MRQSISTNLIPLAHHSSLKIEQVDNNMAGTHNYSKVLKEDDQRIQTRHHLFDPSSFLHPGLYIERHFFEVGENR